MKERYIMWEPYAQDVGKVTGILEGNIPPEASGGLWSPSPDPVDAGYPGLDKVLLIKISTKELYHNYVKPQTVENRIEDMSVEQSVQKESIMNLYEILLGGAV